VLQDAGVSAIAIHGRRKDDRPRHQALYDELPLIVDHVTVPVIFNGDCFVHEDIARLKKRTKASSMMIARGAMWNPTIFQRTMLPLYDVIKEYVKIARSYNNRWPNTKYVINQMLCGQIGSEPEFTNFTRKCRHDMDLDEHVALFGKLPRLTEPYRPPFTEWAPRPKRRNDKQ
jgi:tRNA-dihydrouridine synthase